MNTNYLNKMFAVTGMLFLLMTGACKKAENYFDNLVTTPEIRLDYTKSFQVGSQMVLTGRLNPDKGLVVKIGDVEASYQVLDKVMGGGSQADPYYVDQISITITKEMGIGKERPVTITSGGKTLTCPPVEIYLPKNLDYQLKFQEHYTLKPGDVTLWCVNGQGNIYLYRKAQGDIVKINPEGALTTVLQQAALTDVNSTFTVSEFYGGGIDPQESTLYFSALTTDASLDNASNRIYRICKLNLASRQLQTINRTVLSKAEPVPQINLKTPYEGQISNVSLMEVYKFYPDSKGNLYMQLGGHQYISYLKATIYNYYATVMVDNSGSLKYIFKTASNATMPLPGLGITQLQGQIMPDEKRMYCPQVPGRLSADFTPTTITQYDLGTGSLLYTYLKTRATTIRDQHKPTISGSFTSLTGVFTSGSNGSDEASQLFGLMAMPNERLMVYYYQSGVNSFNNTKYEDFPALGVLDMMNKQGERYAPGSLSAENYLMYNSGSITSYSSLDDEMLNYDTNGMIYMTADNRAVILKTTRK